MKIKHFAGYGSVNAEKIKMERNGNGVTILHIRVTGDHEYGLKRDSWDTYGLYNIDVLADDSCMFCITESYRIINNFGD